MKQELITDVGLLQLVKNIAEEVCSYYNYDCMFNDGKFVVYNPCRKFVYGSYKDFLKEWLSTVEKDNHSLKHKVKLAIKICKFIKE